MTDEVDYDLTCWYLNLRRVVELVGAEQIAGSLPDGRSISQFGDPLQKHATLSAAKDALVDWFASANPPTLGQLLSSGKPPRRGIFTHYSNYYCRGLPAVFDAIRTGKEPVPMAEAYTKLRHLKDGLRLSLPFHHEHLTSKSARVHLSGQKALFALAVVTGVSNQRIRAAPYVIATLLPSFLDQRASPVGSRWSNHLEISVDEIDNFEKVTRVKESRKRLVKELHPLRNIPEKDIKKAFAEIVGEPNVPSDWGGEQSDLFTSWTAVDGRRMRAAFAFKGPAKFRPLKMTGLGKNGDQIVRLFSEPADLLILQHCHTITQPVRATMRAHAQQIGNPRLFCLIDGYDTLRVLRGYGKCGL